MLTEKKEGESNTNEQISLIQSLQWFLCSLMQSDK